ncbi:MAG TPA: hypothetical protein VFG04_02595 [Planctomycetaceae bacterium]|nr:hypothetical protein [Planctomycetaceae bacterium]
MQPWRLRGARGSKDSWKFTPPRLRKIGRARDIVDAPRICEHWGQMEPPTELLPDTAASAPTETPVEELTSAPTRVLGFELGDILSFCILIGFSAWLWSRASADLGRGAPLLGAAIGLAIACLVRAFC